MAKKVQLPVVGGIRKVVTVDQAATTGTTIAGFAHQTLTIAQLRALLGLKPAVPNTQSSGVSANAALIVGPGLSGGGALVGTVPLNLTAPVPLIAEDTIFEDVISFQVPTTPAGSNTQIQYNGNGAFAASAGLTWTDSTSVLSIGQSTGGTITAFPNITTTSVGASLTISSASGGSVSGNGGALSILAGNGVGSTNGGGGALLLQAGSGSTLHGAGSNVTGGTATLAAGNGGTSGLPSATSIGGGLNLAAGTGESQGGSVVCNAGSATAGGGGGSISFTSGQGAGTGSGGNLSFSSGGAATTGNGGTFSVATGNAGGAAASTSGPITFITGSGGTSGNSGSITFQTGPAVGGTVGNILFEIGNTTVLTIVSTGAQIAGNLSLTAIGNKFAIKEGVNASMGLGTLVGGTLTVANTLITANTRIFIVNQGGGVVANIGDLYISARVAGISFTVTSTNAADTSSFAWLLVEPG